MAETKKTGSQKKDDKEKLKVTPLGTNRNRKNIPDSEPQEEFIQQKSTKSTTKN